MKTGGVLIEHALPYGRASDTHGGAQFRLSMSSTLSVGLILVVAFKPRLARDEWPRRVSDE